MTVKTDNIQIGQNATATQNFTLTQNADGTCKLARGNVGATTQDVLTIDANGKFSFPQGVAARTDTVSMIRLNTANGYGSTNTAIRRFTNIVTNQGTDITYTDSATLGGSFTINTSGVYSIDYSDQFSAASHFGISLNTTQPTISIVTLTNLSEIVVVQVTPAAGQAGNVSATLYLPAGSIIRAHAEAVSSGVTVKACQFIITRVA